MKNLIKEKDMRFEDGKDGQTYEYVIDSGLGKTVLRGIKVSGGLATYGGHFIDLQGGVEVELISRCENCIHHEVTNYPMTKMDGTHMSDRLEHSCSKHDLYIGEPIVNTPMDVISDAEAKTFSCNSFEEEMND